VISVILAVTPTRAIPFAPLRLCEKHSADRRCSLGIARKAAKNAKPAKA
jgi:hypothetical protein